MPLAQSKTANGWGGRGEVKGSADTSAGDTDGVWPDEVSRDSPYLHILHLHACALLAHKDVIDIHQDVSVQRQ